MTPSLPEDDALQSRRPARAPQARGVWRGPAVVAALTALAVSILAYFGIRQVPLRDPFAPPPAPLSVPWWLTPSETNAFLRRPPIRADLHGVAFLQDGRHGWAVGAASTVLSTDDGGQSWHEQHSGTDAWLSKVTFPGDGKQGWAVGTDGTTRKTTSAMACGGRNPKSRCPT